MTSLGELGYHPAYQPAPGETHYDYTHPHDRRPYTRGENIAGGLIVATAVAPGFVVGTAGLYIRTVWSLARSALGRAVVAGPIAQYGKIKALDSYINKADFVYTTYQYMQHRDKFRKSPGNSSQVLPAGSARPGGTTVPPILPTRTINRMMKMSNSADRSRWRREGGACPSGYELKKVKGKWMCVRKTSKKSRSR